MKNPWIKDGKFVELKGEELEGLSAEQHGAYIAAKTEADAEALKANFTEQIEDLKKTSASKEEIEALTAKMDTALGEMNAYAVKIKALGEKASKSEDPKATFKSMFDEHKAKLDNMKEDKSSVSFVLKANQEYGDIDSGLDFAQMQAGVTDQPVRRPFIQDLFPRIPLSTEHLKYVEQDSVVRDAQNVAACTSVTTGTKETLLVSDISTVRIKDIVKFCIDFVNDYPFMRARINTLIKQSIALRIEQQVLLGTGAGNETNSIDLYSSEFNAANPACPFDADIQDATYTDLLEAMAAQIVEFGQQGTYMPDTALVNYCDWVKFIKLSKDTDGRYIHPNFITSNGLQIAGLTVRWSPIVPANTCYVFDSTKGDIIDRMATTIDVAFQNADEWEQEIASIKGYVRMNFLVKNENANAFMKCSDVETAITAITKP